MTEKIARQIVRKVVRLLRLSETMREIAIRKEARNIIARENEILAEIGK